MGRNRDNAYREQEKTDDIGVTASREVGIGGSLEHHQRQQERIAWRKERGGLVAAGDEDEDGDHRGKQTAPEHWPRHAPEGVPWAGSERASGFLDGGCLRGEERRCDDREERHFLPCHRENEAQSPLVVHHCRHLRRRVDHSERECEPREQAALPQHPDAENPGDEMRHRQGKCGKGAREAVEQGVAAEHDSDDDGTHGREHGRHASDQ